MYKAAASSDRAGSGAPRLYAVSRWGWNSNSPLRRPADRSDCSRSRGTSRTSAARLFTFITSKSLVRSWAMPPQATPPTFPGITSEPWTEGGVKCPSERSALIVLRHHARSASVAPQAASAASAVGASDAGAVGKRLRPRRCLTRDIALWHGPLLDWNQWLSVQTVEDEQMAGLGSDGDRRDSPPVLAPFEEDWRRCDVVIPEIMVNGLKVPDACASISA